MNIRRIISNSEQQPIDTTDSQDHHIYTASTHLSKNKTILFYIDKLNIKDNLNETEITIVLSHTINNITKGYDDDSWVLASNLKNINIKNNIHNLDNKKIFKKVGFNLVAKEHELLSVDYYSLNLDIKNSKNKKSHGI